MIFFQNLLKNWLKVTGKHKYQQSRRPIFILGVFFKPRQTPSWTSDSKMLKKLINYDFWSKFTQKMA